MTDLFHDFETYCDLDIKKVGAEVYARHPSCEVLMLSYAVDDGPVKLWVPAEIGHYGIPRDLFELLLDQSVTLRAFNAPFERAIWTHVLKMELPVSRFRCTAVEAYALSFAGKLGEIGAQLGLPEDAQKLAIGQKLIDRFCKPAPSNHKARRYTRHTHPEEWETFKQYCIRDTEAERAIHWRLEPYRPMSPFEWRVWELDQAINARGLPIDTAMVEAAITLHQTAQKRLLERMREWTGLANPNSAAQLLPWLAAAGCPLPNMQATTIDAALKDPFGVLSPVVRDVLQAKRRVAMTAPTKWKAYRNRTCTDGRLRGAFQYGGAGRTLRWSSRGQNLQNLKRPPGDWDMDVAAQVTKLLSPELIEALFGDVIEFLSCTVRAGVGTAAGRRITAADLASIESRFVGWLTGCKFFNETFAAGLCTYRKMAVDLFSVEYDAVDKKQRQFAKPVVLAGPYGQGGKGLQDYAKNYGVDLTLEESHRHVKAFRKRCPEITTFWSWLETAINAAIIYGAESTGYYLKVYVEGEFLFIDLPSGRRLNYFEPRMEMHETPWGEIKPTFTYMGQNQDTRKWCRLRSHMGGVTENIVQAGARDLLADILLRLDAQGAEIILHVHDEAGIEVLEEYADAALECTLETMRQPIPWAPGLLLDAGGYTAVHYRKD